MTLLRYEWDEAKNRSSRRKHGMPARAVLTRVIALVASTMLFVTANAALPTDPLSLTSPTSDGGVAPSAVAEISSIKVLSGPSWSPDGRQVLYRSTESGVPNIWVMDVSTHRARQLAPSKEPQGAPSWSPDGRHVLFTADTAGDELYDIFMVDVATGKVENLTRTPTRAEQSPGWSPDSRQIVFSARDKDSPSAEIGVLDLRTRKTRFLTQNTQPDRTRIMPMWSRRGDFIYYNDARWSMSDTNVARVRPDGSGMENLTPHRGEQVFRMSDLSPDGAHVLLASDAQNGWRNVALLDTRTRDITWVTDEPATFIAGGFAPNGTRVSYTREQEMNVQLFVYDIARRQAVAVTRSPGVHELRGMFPSYSNATFRDTFGTTFSPDSAELLYVRESTTTPRELVKVSVDGASERTLIDNPLAPETSRALVAPTHVWYRSRDGLFMIPAQVWIPPNLARDGSNPAVVEIHGGPQDQTRPALLTYIQVLTARGYIVISPNYRGSIGYSREFFTANRMDLGGGELQDVEAAADFLIATGYVSPHKIAAYGASHGGYVTLLAVGRNPQKWAAGVALYPEVDWLASYEHDMPWLRVASTYLIGDPKSNAEFWRARSPLTYANRITAPVLMDVGSNDPRVPADAPRMMQKAILDQGGVAELKIYGEQGHGRPDTDSYIDENTLVIRFLDKYLRK